MAGMMSWPSLASRVSRLSVEITHLLVNRVDGVKGEDMDEGFDNWCGVWRGNCPHRQEPSREARSEAGDCSRVHPFAQDAPRGSLLSASPWKNGPNR